MSIVATILLIANVIIGSIVFLYYCFVHLQREKFLQKAEFLQKMALLLEKCIDKDIHTCLKKYPICCDLINHTTFIYRKILRNKDWDLNHISISNQFPKWFDERGFVDELNMMVEKNEFEVLETLKLYGEIIALMLRITHPIKYILSRTKQIIMRISVYLITVISTCFPAILKMKGSICYIRTRSSFSQAPKCLVFID